MYPKASVTIRDTTTNDRLRSTCDRRSQTIAKRSCDKSSYVSKTIIYRINAQNPACDRNRSKISRPCCVTIVSRTTDVVAGSRSCSVTEAKPAE